jgi:large subunit ribosomal protein L4
VVHGPTPRNYAQRTPKKMKAAALRGALSDRARGGRVHVVTGVVEGEVPSTRTAVTLLAGITDRRHVLVVIDRADVLTARSIRNVKGVHLIQADQLNTYDVLVSDDVVFTQPALEAFLAGPIGQKARAVAAADAAFLATLTDEFDDSVEGDAPVVVDELVTVEPAGAEVPPLETPDAPAGSTAAPADATVPDDASETDEVDQ